MPTNTSFNIRKGSPLVVMKKDKDGNDNAHLSSLNLGDLLCRVVTEENKAGIMTVAIVMSITDVKSELASFITGSFIPNDATPEDCDVQMDETRRPVDTTKITVSLLTPTPLTLAVFSDEKMGYVNVVLTENSDLAPFL